jgi:tetratricopeptide (TPR) repeat protein
VVFKGWFKGGDREERPDEQRTIEDLIVLERYAEAEERLKARLKRNPQDLHSHLKLADVYTALRQVGSALDEYIFVAEEYAQDGFYDKGIALLARAQKLVPADEQLALKIAAFHQAKGLEHKRSAAVDGLRQGRGGDTGAGTRVLLLQRLWHNLAASGPVQRLPADQIQRLFAAGDLAEVAAGEQVAREGETRAELLLIVDGVVEAWIDEGGSAERSVRTFGPRDILGEQALLERKPWPASYRAAEIATMLVLDRGGLERLLTGNPDPLLMLEVLREQHNDRDVATTVRNLRTRS